MFLLSIHIEALTILAVTGTVENKGTRNMQHIMALFLPQSLPSYCKSHAISCLGVN